MPRRGDDVRTRLQQAALELYREHGYDRTTTAQIAERVGVTERTYFRHFGDKREVLFDGEAKLKEALTGAMAKVPGELGPLDALQRAFRAVEGLLEENRSFSGPRHAVIAETPALQERELTKIAALADTLATLLRQRGVDGRMATLAAQAGMAAFSQAAIAWLAAPEVLFDDHLTRAFQDLRALTAY